MRFGCVNLGCPRIGHPRFHAGLDRLLFAPRFLLLGPDDDLHQIVHAWRGHLQHTLQGPRADDRQPQNRVRLNPFGITCNKSRQMNSTALRGIVSWISSPSGPRRLRGTLTASPPNRITAPQSCASFSAYILQDDAGVVFHTSTFRLQ